MKHVCEFQKDVIYDLLAVAKPLTALNMKK